MTTPSRPEPAVAEGDNPDLFDYELLRNYLGFVAGAAVRRKFLALGVFVGILGLTVGALKVLPKTYHVECKLLAQRTHVLQRQKELQVELGSLRQLRRIEDIAAQHLGLRPPQAAQVIYVRPGQQHGVGQRRE